MSESANIAYVSFWDMPYYSIAIVNLTSMETLVKHSTSSYVEKQSFESFMKNLKISNGTYGRAVDEESMQIDTDSTSSILSSLNTSYPMTVVKSIESVFIDGQDQVLCALADGTVLQFYVEMSIIQKMMDNPKEYPP